MLVKRSYRHWSRDEVVREIRRLAAEGSALYFGYVARHRPDLAYAARKYLGGWQAAIEEAGLDYSQIRRRSSWDRRSIVERVRELAGRGEPLNVSAAEERYGGLVAAAIQHFGSWREALAAAGLDYESIRRQQNWSRQKIVRRVRMLHRQGVALRTTTEVRRNHRGLHAAAVRYFGSWAETLEAARLGRLIRQAGGSRRPSPGEEGGGKR